METDWEKYDFPSLYEMAFADDPDDLTTWSKAWSDYADHADTVRTNLKAYGASLATTWTSGSGSEQFFTMVDNVVDGLDRAASHAVPMAGVLSRMAKDLTAARKDMNDLADEYKFMLEWNNPNVTYTDGHNGKQVTGSLADIYSSQDSALRSSYFEDLPHSPHNVPDGLKPQSLAEVEETYAKKARKQMKDLADRYLEEYGSLDGEIPEYSGPTPTMLTSPPPSPGSGSPPSAPSAPPAPTPPTPPSAPSTPTPPVAPAAPPVAPGSPTARGTARVPATPGTPAAAPPGRPAGLPPAATSPAGTAPGGASQAAPGPGGRAESGGRPMTPPPGTGAPSRSRNRKSGRAPGGAITPPESTPPSGAPGTPPPGQPLRPKPPGSARRDDRRRSSPGNPLGGVLGAASGAEQQPFRPHPVTSSRRSGVVGRRANPPGGALSPPAVRRSSGGPAPMTPSRGTSPRKGSTWQDSGTPTPPVIAPGTGGPAENRALPGTIGPASRKLLDSVPRLRPGVIDRPATPFRPTSSQEATNPGVIGSPDAGSGGRKETSKPRTPAEQRRAVLGGPGA